MHTSIWCWLSLLCVAGSALADNTYTLPVVSAPLMQPPVIDGNIGEEEWSGTVRMERFGRAGQLAPQGASFWVGTDGRELFVAVRSETPPDNALKATILTGPSDTDARTFEDDSVEVVLDPLRESGVADRPIFHAIFNSRGAIYDQAYRNGGTQPWRGHWRIGNIVKDNFWSLELAVLWSDLGIQGEVLKRQMGIRVTRTWKQTSGPSQTEWSPLGGAYITPETIPLVTWNSAAPVVRMLGLTDKQGDGRLQMEVVNPGVQAQRLNVVLETKPRNSAPVELKQPLTLNAGEKKLLELPFSATESEELFSRVLVTGEDGTTYYSRDWSWNLARPADLWEVQAKSKTPFQASFAYFPSHGRLKVKADFTNFEQSAQVRGVQLSLIANAGVRVFKTVDMPPLKGKVSEMEWPIGNLPEGQYQLQIQPRGVEKATVRLPFVRHRFEWEGNRLGKSKVVLPPFQPLRVSGNMVTTSLREHAVSPEGLWGQVTSLGQTLLRSPMRLEVKAGDKTYIASGTGTKFPERRPEQLTSSASWKAGPLSGVTRGTWDYDGVMRCELELSKTQASVEAVTLVIPLDDSQIPLMHTCTDGIRFNFAGATPKGEGVIWNSIQAAHNSIIGSFVPYIWLGGEERGLSVFADNDKGWRSDSKIPAQQLVRLADGTLELRLNLISQPARLDEARKITLGFQATPVKPMPENWRLWTISGKASRQVPGSFDQLFFASGYYWGTLTAAADIYPRDQDFSLFREYASIRKTGVADPALIDKWLAATKSPSEKDEKQYRPSLQWAITNLKKQPRNVMLYTNPRGVRYDTPEGQTFLDEWHRDPFPPREWKYGGGAFYDLDPVPSYRDYAAFYYDKMLRSFADSIYFDDVFLQSNFDTIGTDAYQLPDGNTQPSSGVWNMRELIHRAAVLGQERGYANNNMAHMTNSAIAPILSFARTQLTWEDRSGDSDFQDRFSREYIRAESIGRQFGNVPFALSLIKSSDPAKVAWAERTQAGVMLTHEIKPWGATLKTYWENYDRLLDFGYGSPDVKVWNYWQAEKPVTVTGGETSLLVVSRPQRTLIIVCDYGSGGDLKLRFRASELGLSGNVVATDLENNRNLVVNGEEVALTLKKHDFAVIELRNP